MKFLFDLFPVILFFGVFKWGDKYPEAARDFAAHYLSAFMSHGASLTTQQAPILLATATAILASMAQIGYLLVRRKKVDGMLWLSFVIIAVLGGATIYFGDATFVKWKPTILYWGFALALLVSQLFIKKNLIQMMMGKQLKLPNPVWQKLNLAWLVFFLAMGLLNLYVAFNFEQSLWVDFKLFGITGLMLVFVIVQGLFLSKYMKEPE